MRFQIPISLNMQHHLRRKKSHSANLVKLNISKYQRHPGPKKTSQLELAPGLCTLPGKNALQRVPQPLFTDCPDWENSKMTTALPFCPCPLSLTVLGATVSARCREAIRPRSKTGHHNCRKQH